MPPVADVIDFKMIHAFEQWVDLDQIVLAGSNAREVPDDEIVVEGVKIVSQKADWLAGIGIVMFDGAGERKVAIDELQSRVGFHQFVEPGLEQR